MTHRSNAAAAIGSLTSERDWMAIVTDAAELFGWRWAHFRPARTDRGWRTPVSGPLGKGWPDLTLVRGDRLIFAELKVQDGRLRPEQRDVLDGIDRRHPPPARGAGSGSPSAPLAPRGSFFYGDRNPDTAMLTRGTVIGSNAVPRPARRCTDG